MVKDFGNKNEPEEHCGKDVQLPGLDITKLKHRSEHDFDIILMYTHKVKERLALEKHRNNALACQKWGSYLKSLQSAIKVMELVRQEL